MILGLGIDVCAVERMQERIQTDRFLDRCFAPEEKTYIRSRGRGAPDSAAACFAAKEAFLKAMGMGLGAVDLREIVLMHDEKGAPFLVLRGAAKAQANLRGARRMFVSVSHDSGVAAAVVLMEG